ncbi:MAG TPA: hypothetical protein VFF77_04940 [Holophagaceae bacterium]|nr:hypothetical protein [Holophagaceae bacterium]
MKIQPVLIIGQDGQSPVQPIQAGDLVPLATEATLASLAKDATSAAILAAIQALPKPHTHGVQITVDLSVAHADTALALAPIATVQRVKVKSLTGGTATLKFGGAAESAFDLATDDDFLGLSVAALTLNNAATPGASLVLQIFGR